MQGKNNNNNNSNLNLSAKKSVGNQLITIYLFNFNQGNVLIFVFLPKLQKTKTNRCLILHELSMRLGLVNN